MSGDVFKWRGSIVEAKDESHPDLHEKGSASAVLPLFRPRDISFPMNRERKPRMNHRILSFLVLAATIVIPTTAAHASARSASKYLYSDILPPGAEAADSGRQHLVSVGNPINSEGDIAADAYVGRECGDLRAFVYLSKTQQYVVIGATGANPQMVGIADDKSISIDTLSCSSDQSLIYQITSVDTTPQFSQPCTCRGYSPVGYNSDGVALDSHKLGPAVLTFPNGAPKISPLPTDVGAPPRRRSMLWVRLTALLAPSATPRLTRPCQPCGSTANRIFFPWPGLGRAVPFPMVWTSARRHTDYRST